MSQADWAAFVLDYGFRVPTAELAAIVGQEEHAIDRLRSHSSCAPLPARLPYAALFAAWHGRAPDETEWLTPKLVGQNYSWEPPELALLATLNGQFGLEQIASVLTMRLRAVTGDPTAERNRNGVLMALHRIGLQAGDLVGGLTVQQATQEVGSEAVVRHAIGLGRLQTQRVGHRILIPDAAWSTWRAGRRDPPPGYVPLSSIRERLAIRSDAKLSEFAKDGHIPGAMQCDGASGRPFRWYLPKEVADKLVEDRHAGQPMPWHGKPLTINLKNSYRLWLARRHPSTCAECTRIWGTAGAPDSPQAWAERYPPLTRSDKRHLTRNADGTPAPSRVHDADAPPARRYTLREAADEVAMTLAWVKKKIRRGVVKVKTDAKGKQYLTEAMMARLRRAWIVGDDEPPLTDDWLFARAAALEAGISVATLDKWAVDGLLDRRDTPRGWRYHRDDVRACARSYWGHVRYKRATPPLWLATEHAGRTGATAGAVASVPDATSSMP